MKKCCKLNLRTLASYVGITTVTMLLFSLWIDISWIDTTFAAALPNKAEVKITSPSKGQQVEPGVKRIRLYGRMWQTRRQKHDLAHQPRLLGTAYSGGRSIWSAPSAFTISGSMRAYCSRIASISP